MFTQCNNEWWIISFYRHLARVKNRYAVMQWHNVSLHKTNATMNCKQLVFIDILQVMKYCHIINLWHRKVIALVYPKSLSTLTQLQEQMQYTILYYFHEHFSFAGSKQHRLLNLVEKKLSFLCLLRSVNELMLHIHFFMMSIKTNVDKHSLTHWLCVSQWWHHRIILTSCQ